MKVRIMKKKKKNQKDWLSGYPSDRKTCRFIWLGGWLAGWLVIWVVQGKEFSESYYSIHSTRSCACEDFISFILYLYYFILLYFRFILSYLYIFILYIHIIFLLLSISFLLFHFIFPASPIVTPLPSSFP